MRVLTEPAESSPACGAHRRQLLSLAKNSHFHGWEAAGLEAGGAPGGRRVLYWQISDIRLRAGCRGGRQVPTGGKPDLLSALWSVTAMCICAKGCFRHVFSFMFNQTTFPSSLRKRQASLFLVPK